MTDIERRAIIQSGLIALLQISGLSLRRSEHRVCCVRRPIPATSGTGRNTMRILTILRAATLALSLFAVTGAGAFAATSSQAPSPYDGPDFVVAPADIH